jgi:hypothetical protein
VIDVDGKINDFIYDYMPLADYHPIILVIKPFVRCQRPGIREN